ncbi:hypothetical protein EI94DRAFT_1707626, partial [Lactarius quietus]
MEKPITLAVVGCGQRGTSYAWFSYKEPAKCRVVAIAEPRSNTRTRFASQYGVDSKLVFESWEQFYKASAETIQTLGKRLADAVVIAVQDHMHAELVVAFAAQGYDILCEKPMATSIDHCLQIEAAVKKAGVIFGMGHVLRYSQYSRAITEVVRSGQLGQLINAQHIEPVGHWHFAHSYVRGNWSKEAESSYSLMTKSCHDIDILCHWLSPDTPVHVSSFGGLQHFRKSSKPAEAGMQRGAWIALMKRSVHTAPRR